MSQLMRGEFSFSALSGEMKRKSKTLKTLIVKLFIFLLFLLFLKVKFVYNVYILIIIQKNNLYRTGIFCLIDYR